jgi:glyoxylase-like metal-dependent hydrolase (beta-lactamase superfamily II)
MKLHPALAAATSRTFAIILLAGILSTVTRAEVTTPVLEINKEAANPTITVQKLRGNLSVVMGSGGNIVVLNTPNGKLLGDAGIAVSKLQIEAALASIGPAPLKYLIDTHYHWDHTDGNVWVHDAGATIIAHENTLKRLTSGTRVIEWGYFFPATAQGGLPTILVKDEKTMVFEGETIVMKHYGPGHTDTDISVYFKNADVLQVGDIWWNGNIDGLIRWVNECINASTEHTIIVPGHGEVSNRAGLTEFRDMLVTVRANVANLKKSGKTLAETVAAKPTAAFDAKYGDFLINPAFFIQLVYMDV